MEEKDFVQRDEFEKFKREVDNKFDNVKDTMHQIEKSVIKIEYATTTTDKSMEEFKTSMVNFKSDMAKNYNSLLDKLNGLTEKPARDFDKYKFAICSCIITGIVAYILGVILK